MVNIKDLKWQYIGHVSAVPFMYFAILEYSVDIYKVKCILWLKYIDLLLCLCLSIILFMVGYNHLITIDDDLPKTHRSKPSFILCYHGIRDMAIAFSIWPKNKEGKLKVGHYLFVSQLISYIIYENFEVRWN